MTSADGENPRAGGLSLRAAMLLAGAVVLAIAVWAWNGRTKAPPSPHGPPEAPLPTRLAPEELSQSEADHEAPSVAGGYRREIERPKPVQNVAIAAPPKDDAPTDPAQGGPASRRRDEKKTLPEIFRMPPDPRPAATEPTAGTTRPSTHVDESRQLGDEFAPFGRLLKCLLVDTLDSVTARAEPIVGVVTQDLDWNGNVIIPAGTEAFSYAKPEAAVDAAGIGRLVDNGEWTLVLPGRQGAVNGRELILKARAVDRVETAVTATGTALSWGVDDGADGLVGYTLSTLDNQEIKLFAAAAIGGMSQGISAVVQRQQPAAGVAGVLGATQVAPTAGNALAGSGRVWRRGGHERGGQPDPGGNLQARGLRAGSRGQGILSLRRADNRPPSRGRGA